MCCVLLYIVLWYLDAVLGQLGLHGQQLSGVHVGVVSIVEGLLQLLQLMGCEHRPVRTRTRTLVLLLLGTFSWFVQHHFLIICYK